MPSSCLKLSRALLWLAGLVIGVGGVACGGNAGLGEACSSVSDCADSLQCLDHTCVPRCTRNSDCGDGHACRSGVCETVVKQVGDSCASEFGCGPGQSCQLADEDIDGDGFLTASCQLEHPGGVLDDACGGGDQAANDAQCRTGTCVLGRCVDVCADDYDCPASHRCTTIPRELASGGDAVASFRGCLPASGDIQYTLPITASYSHFLLPVPGSARSVALVASVDHGEQLVGAAYIRAPGGDELYRLPIDRAAYFDNLVRSDLMPGAWTLVLPQTPQVPLEPGAYAVELGSYIDHTTPGTDVPHVDAIYKLGDNDTAQVHLDLHFYFLDLRNHPCASDPDLDGVVLDETTAQVSSSPFQTVFLHELNLMLASAGVAVDLATATYADIADRPDLDHLDSRRLGDLLSLSDVDGGISVFFVRTIAPTGVQALVGGPPGPPGRAGTRASGVAVGLDTLCYRDWALVARDAVHEIARALGLMRSVEPDGYTDPIDDSDTEATNLMYFSEFGGATLSPGQKSILRRSAALR